MLFMIQCVDKPNSLDLRMATRPAHIEYIHSHEEKVFVAGPTLADDGAAMTGTVIIYEAPDRAAAEAFSNNDPYYKAGLFASRSFTPWKLITFYPAAAGK
jgi:uncharacterized protein YciI